MPGSISTLFAQAQPAAELPGGYGASLLQALLALLAVCALAWVVLRYLSRAGVGQTKGERIRIVERVALDPQRQLYIVRVDERQLLVGVGREGAPTLLTELHALSPAPDAAVTTRAVEGDKGAFAEALRRIRKGHTAQDREPTG